MHVDAFSFKPLCCHEQIMQFYLGICLLLRIRIAIYQLEFSYKSHMCYIPFFCLVQVYGRRFNSMTGAV